MAQSFAATRSFDPPGDARCTRRTRSSAAFQTSTWRSPDPTRTLGPATQVHSETLPGRGPDRRRQHRPWRSTSSSFMARWDRQARDDDIEQVDIRCTRPGALLPATSNRRQRNLPSRDGGTRGQQPAPCTRTGVDRRDPRPAGGSLPSRHPHQAGASSPASPRTRAAIVRPIREPRDTGTEYPDASSTSRSKFICMSSPSSRPVA